MASNDTEAGRAAASALAGKKDRLDILKAKLRARSGNPAYNENCAAIKKDIERLEREIAERDL